MEIGRLGHVCEKVLVSDAYGLLINLEGILLWPLFCSLAPL